jgi:hypothetical protein
MRRRLIRSSCARHSVKVCLAASIALFASAQVVYAQTRFEWISTRANYDRYTSSYECLAAAERVRDSVSRQSHTVVDTMSRTPALALQPVPAALRETAQRCEAHVATSTQPLSDFAPRLQLYLLAGRDSDAAGLVAQRLKAAVPATPERAAVLDTVIRAYLDQPARLASTEPLLKELEKATTAAPLEMRIVDHYFFMKAAQEQGDTTRARGAAEYLTSINSRLTASERLRLSGQVSTAAGVVAYAALQFLHQGDLLDSLRRNVDGFIALQRANWALATGERAEALHLPLGEEAPPLEGEYWFGRRDSTVTRPTRGKVAMVVSTLPEPECALACAPIYAVLRRIAQRFPELEITLAAKTAGYVSRQSMPPRDEAEKMRHWWLDEEKIPAALVVSNTDFWRLPAPDRRRINREMPNELHYSFGPWKGGGVTFFVIDRRGRVVSVAPAVPEYEMYISQIIEILLQQQSASR